MQLKHVKSIVPSGDGINRVTSIAWAPSNTRCAFVLDRTVVLLDENGEKRDKFATKPASDKGPKNYVVTGLAFSPDGSRLAVAQSDCIIFVYKLGLEWGEKKSICNKFAHTSPITCMVWPSAPGAGGDLLFGCADGKVRVAMLKTNKPATLFSSDSYVLAAAPSPNGNAVVTGHIDGSIYVTLLDDLASTGAVSATKLCIHSCPPTVLAWGNDIVAAGSDGKVSFYGHDGSLTRTFDYSGDSSVKDFTSAVANPTGEAVILGNFNRFHVYALEAPVTSAGSGAASAPEWREASIKVVEGLYTITALAWKTDGSKVAVGTLCGGVELFDACLRRVRYKGKFEFTYVSPSTVIVKRLSSGMRIVLRSSFGYEVQRIKVYRDRFLIANTARTLLAGDLESCRLSEVPWISDATLSPSVSKGKDASAVSIREKTRYYLENPAVALVYRAGELSVVEYGRTDVLASCRTEYMSPHTVSVRLHDKPAGVTGPAASKVMAYLLDAHTARVLDLVSGSTLATVDHDCRIDWLELNGRGTLLLFRDVRHKLHLYDLTHQSRSTLLPYCNYAQWVPDSDVVVAQRRTTLCVWYNIRAPDRMTSYEIKGDVEEIVRGGGKSEVIVDEGMSTASYLLDEGLIAFGSAMEEGNFGAAVATLEGLELTPETSGMWSQCAETALAAGELHVAERCAVALGDVARAKYLHKTAKIAAGAAARLGGDGRDFWMVKSRLAQLRKDVAGAEGVLLEQGKVEQAVEMYQTLHAWDDAVAVAESQGMLPSAVDKMKSQYVQYLLSSGQEERAAVLREREGDIMGAVNLYLKGNYPARAAALLAASPQMATSKDLMEKVTTALAAAGMYEKAGTLMERIGDGTRALEAYIRGQAFRQAVELARKVAPARVVELEKQWGDYLLHSQWQPDAAIGHYIEAGAHAEAINAAVASRQYQKAAQLLQDTFPSGSAAAKPFWHKLAVSAVERGLLEEAERYFTSANEGRAAVDMYINAGKWEAAIRVARICMTDAEFNAIASREASRLEAAGQHRQAEKLLVTMGAIDLAVAMYTRAKSWEALVRLVGTHRPAKLRETHLLIAKSCVNDGNWRQAELHYVEAGDWEEAVGMYRNANIWEEAIRVARTHGGPAAAHKVAYTQALAVGGDAGLKLLQRQGLIEEAVLYAQDTAQWEVALELAGKHAPQLVAGIHVKRGMAFEDQGNFVAAEAEFVAGDRPKEAIEMYLHAKDWNAALRVAENYDPNSVVDVLIGQAREAVLLKDFATAEALFLDAKRPDLAVDAYIQSNAFPEALRVAKRHMPHKINEVNDRIKRAVAGESTSPSAAADTKRGAGAAAKKSAGGKSDVLATARAWEMSGDLPLAIDAYLSVGGASDATSRSPDELESAWTAAVRLAMSNDLHQRFEVAEEAAHMLAEIGKYAAAGDIFSTVEQPDQAAECYMNAGLWSKAREAASMAPMRVREAVETAYKNAMMKGSDSAASSPDATDASLRSLAAQGSYDKLFEVASKAGSTTLAQYIYPYVSDQIAMGRVADAVAVLSKYGAPASAVHLPVYTRLVKSLFAVPTTRPVDAGTVHAARDVLYKVVAALRKPGAEVTTAALAEFDRLLLCLHYASSRLRYLEMGLKDLAGKLTVSMIRFAGSVIPADIAFFQAGAIARDLGWKALSFALLNRYVDICDVIDEHGDPSHMDNSDFVGSGFPPPSELGPLSKHYVEDESVREEVRNWILATSIERKSDNSLPTRPCFSCGTTVFEGAPACAACKTSFPTCIVTGYPIPASQTTTCGACGSKAHKTSWNAVVTKTKACPWCASASSSSL